jgi:hypothetical protein
VGVVFGGVSIRAHVSRLDSQVRAYEIMRSTEIQVVVVVIKQSILSCLWLFSIRIRQPPYKSERNQA